MNDERISEAFVGSEFLQAGRAAYDFRSDTRTTPTLSMLKAIAMASLEDGVAHADPSTIALEAKMVQLTRKPAALFVLSGTMGNILGIRSLLTQPPYAVLCDARAHCANNEAGGAFAFTGAISQPVQPSNGKYLTLEDVMANVKIDRGESVHMCPTRVIALENTLRGMIIPLEEVRRISEFARSNGVRLHLDGARLWEAVAAGAASLDEYCALFDTVTMCFSKGLGAPAGAIVVGEADVIRRARWLKQSIGGGIRQPGILSAAALVSVEETFLGNRLARTHAVAKDLAEWWQGRGGRLQHAVDTNIVWLDLSGLKATLKDLCEIAAQKGLYVGRERLVVHYQISDDAIRTLKEVLGGLLS